MVVRDADLARHVELFGLRVRHEEFDGQRLQHTHVIRAHRPRPSKRIFVIITVERSGDSGERRATSIE